MTDDAAEIVRELRSAAVRYFTAWGRNNANGILLERAASLIESRAVEATDAATEGDVWDAIKGVPIEKRTAKIIQDTLIAYGLRIIRMQKP